MLIPNHLKLQDIKQFCKGKASVCKLQQLYLVEKKCV